MRIEKISDTQIKFILTNADLSERNIRINELVYGSDKTHQLFQDMMRRALAEYEFQSENTPLMVEAMPVGADNIIVIVTKITDMSGIEQKLNLLPLAKTGGRFKRSELIEPAAEPREESISIFSFDTLDTAADAAVRLASYFAGVSCLYKMSGRYYLTLQNESENDRTTADLETVLHEYGQKHVSNVISKQYLCERGELLIKDGALEKLTLYSGTACRE